MDIVVWCHNHNTHFKRQTKRCRGCRPARQGGFRLPPAPRGGIQGCWGGGHHPRPCQPRPPCPGRPHCPALPTLRRRQREKEPRRTVAPAAPRSPDQGSWQGGRTAATSVSVLRPGVLGAALRACPCLRTTTGAPWPPCGWAGARRQLELTLRWGVCPPAVPLPPTSASRQPRCFRRPANYSA